MTNVTILPSGGDDTAAIQAADLQAAAVNGTLLFGPGQFNVSVAGLTMHTSWTGSGRSRTVLKAEACVWPFGVAMVAGASGVELANIGLDFSAVTLGNINYPMVNFTGASDWDVLDCAFTGIKSPAIGIFVSNCLRFSIRNNRFLMPVPSNEFNQAIALSQWAGPNLDGSIEFNQLCGSGMDIEGSFIRIANNTVSLWNFGGGITTQPVCSQLIIANNICTGGAGLDVNNTRPSGIEHWGSDSAITANVCSSNSGSGITIGNAGNTVSGNICSNNGQGGAPNHRE